MTDKAISPLRQRLIEDMAIRRLGPKTQHDYIRHVKRFSDFPGRSADKATAEDVHRYQLWLASIGTTVPTVNVSATALRFFFRVTLRLHDLAEEVVSTREPRRLPVVLSPVEVGRLLASARNIKHKALLSLAYATGLRSSEVVSLKLTDIDSDRMVIRVQQGKSLPRRKPAKAGGKAVTEALWGHAFSASAISIINKSLDEVLRAFTERRLEEPFPYLILDARYERVRGRVIGSRAVLIAVAVDGEGRGPSAHGLDPWGQVLGVDLANRESRTSWRGFLLALKERGLFGVEFVVSDDYEGLRQAIREVLPGAAWQRCYVHFLRNALDRLPRKLADDCLQELRWIGACPRAGQRPDPGDRRELAEVRRDIAQWLAKWQAKHSKLCDWVEENIEETLTPAFAGAGSITACCKQSTHRAAMAATETGGSSPHHPAPR
jgi:integrase